jgi:hypothetical protein
VRRRQLAHRPSGQAKRFTHITPCALGLPMLCPGGRLAPPPLMGVGCPPPPQHHHPPPPPTSTSNSHKSAHGPGRYRHLVRVFAAICPARCPWGRRSTRQRQPLATGHAIYHWEQPEATFELNGKKSLARCTKQAILAHRGHQTSGEWQQRGLTASYSHQTPPPPQRPGVPVAGSFAPRLGGQQPPAFAC